MKIAFDWQGTLDSYQELRDMADSLLRQGWEVMIVSAMPITMQGIREAEIKKNTDLPFTVVYHELENYHKAAGEAKVKYLKENGINFIIDDNSEVSRTMKDAGIVVLQIL